MSEPNLDPLQLLRQRWELASVLNFFHAFEPLIKAELRLSAEEIEAALISPNDDLARLHIALLKGIPPAIKNVKEPNVWITATSKKLAPWWQWVAEGENPLKPENGKEITTYAQLNPVTRLLILKAVCELRGEQEDVLRYITDELKMGRPIMNFRKENIGSNRKGFIFWYDGDSDLGYRLYREEVKIEFKPNWNRKGRLTKPKMIFQWETIATNLEEFREISEKLMSSEDINEAAIGERLKVEILPIVEALHKKRERKHKRQQKEAMVLDGFCNSIRFPRRCRERRPVSYNYDDYDQRINEAINLAENLKKDVNLHEGLATGALQSHSATSSKVDPDSDFTNPDSDSGEKLVTIRGGPKVTCSQNLNLPVVLRRSKRNAHTSNPMGYQREGKPEAKKRLRQRPVVNTDYISDSEADLCNYHEIRISDTESD
ncbi:Remodeling and spacing factor 1 [Rhynchospora pubera]|uniref:Remodeling and spacing factor 1 n=1 Tax=Rhynchospora pubera TaxID=906938 RepID=A0AAV8DAQ4_9POAL|nr:Remodeling and spacing factor 1 [Rhynchospora pubera]KAJ4818645.1 Remodeling and spacing factor 1 [Rhynchospora pubera]